jgi:alpha-L-fucosidase
MEMLSSAKKMNANLLLNVGPLPDVTIHLEDVTTLTEVGKKLQKG